MKRWLRLCLVVLVMMSCWNLLSGCNFDRWIAKALVEPNFNRRLPLARTPKAWGAPYRAFTVKTSDGVAIRGWLLPHPHQLQYHQRPMVEW